MCILSFMTEPTIDPALRQQVLELSGRAELPEFGTHEWLEFQRDLALKDPRVADALKAAMREDDNPEVPPGLVRHLRRAKNRETVNTLKRNVTQRQAPDGRWVPSKNAAVIAVGVVAVLGAFVVLTSQRAGAKQTQSANLLSGAVGIAGRGDLPASGATGDAARPFSGAGVAARDATIAVQPTSPLFGKTNVAAPSVSTAGGGSAASGKTPFTPSTTPVPSANPGSSDPLAGGSQTDATNRPQYGSSPDPRRSAVLSASTGAAPKTGAATALDRSTARSSVPRGAKRAVTAATRGSQPTRVAPTMKIGFSTTRPQVAPPVRVAPATTNPGGVPPTSAPFAQTAASQTAPVVQQSTGVRAVPSVKAGTNPPQSAAVDTASSPRTPATTVFRTDGAPATGSANVAYSRSVEIANSATQASGAPTSVYRREPSAAAPPVSFNPPTAPTSAPMSELPPTNAPTAPGGAQTASASTASLPATLKPGAHIAASLVTTVYAAENATVPVVVTSGEGLWIGRATLGVSKRIEISLERLIDAEGNAFPVQALAFDTNLTQGLSCSVDLVAPTLAADLLQSGLSGLSTYLGGQFGSGTTTTAPSGATTQTRAAPSLLDSVLGQIGGLFKLPDGAQVIVRVARVEKDTPLVVLYGVGAPVPAPSKP